MNLIYPITKNIILKIISLLLAIFLWVYVQADSRSEITFNLPLQITKAPNMAIFGDTPEFINVTFKGRRNVISGLSKDQLKAELDLSDRESSKISYRLTPNNIFTPKGIEVVKIEPDQITIDLDYNVSKEVPIKVITTGQPASNFLIYDFIVVPPTVIIEGAERELKIISHIETTPIIIDGIRGNFTREVNLKAEKKIGIKNINSVKVTVVLWKEKTFQNHEITLLNLNKNLEARPLPETINITLQGLENKIDLLQKEEIKTSIDLYELPPGAYQRKVDISMPAGIECLNYNPKTVNVTIKPR
ncbi:MAG: CdaR family protein [bacterium]|nr:CdaR family protein [bacterium]